MILPSNIPHYASKGHSLHFSSFWEPHPLYLYTSYHPYSQMSNSVIIKYAIILNIIHNIFNLRAVQSLVLFCLLTSIFVWPFSIYIFLLPIWYFQSSSAHYFCIQNGDRVVIISCRYLF